MKNLNLITNFIIFFILINIKVKFGLIKMYLYVILGVNINKKNEDKCSYFFCFCGY